jgi:hypothetical protein
MGETRFNVALAARIDRSQKLASAWSKILEEDFDGLTIQQQRNLAIILNNTTTWLKSLSSKEFDHYGIKSPEEHIRNTIYAYKSLIKNGFNVVGLENQVSSFTSENDRECYTIKASFLAQNAEEIINMSKCIFEKEEPYIAIPYISIYVYAKTNKGKDSIYGSLDYLRWKMAY